MKAGLHIYVPSIPRRYGGARNLVAWAKDYGIAGFIPFGPWHDTRRRWWLSRRECIALTDACAAEGLDATLCGYPSAKSIPEYIADMKSATLPVTTAWLHDPEKHMKAFGAARKLLDASRAAFTRPTGWTSYGAIRGHMAVEPQVYFKLADFHSPQLYDANHVVSRYEQWRRLAEADEDVIPSAGAYKRVLGVPKRRTGPELLAHLGQFVTLGAPVNAIFLWSLPFLGAAQWEAVGTFAEWMARGACVLPRQIT